MKKRDRHSFMLGLLRESEKLETEKLIRSCLECNVVKDEEDMQGLPGKAMALLRTGLPPGD